MKIKVSLFASLRELLGKDEVEVDLTSNGTIFDLLEKLKDQFPELKKINYPLLFAINESYCKETDIIKKNDIIAIFPPVSGG